MLERRIHVLEGYLLVFADLDTVIQIIRENDEPRSELMLVFRLTETQAEAVLNMRLRTLRRLEEEKLRVEHARLAAERSELTELMESEELQSDRIDKEIRDVRARFGAGSDGGARRTRIDSNAASVEPRLEHVEAAEPVTLICSRRGWVRVVRGHVENEDELRYRDDDEGRFVVRTESTADVLVATDKGRLYTLAMSRLPGGRGFGEPIRLHAQISNDEELIACWPADDRPALLATEDGKGFLAQAEDLIGSRSGRQVVTAAEGAKLVVCRAASGDHVAVVGTNRKLLILPLSELPQRSRGQGGVPAAVPDGADCRMRWYSRRRTAWCAGPAAECGRFRSRPLLPGSASGARPGGTCPRDFPPRYASTEQESEFTRLSIQAGYPAVRFEPGSSLGAGPRHGWAELLPTRSDGRAAAATHRDDSPHVTTPGCRAVMSQSSAIVAAIDRLNELIGRWIAWLTLFMVLVTVVIVVLRYGFNIGFIWMQESVRFMYAAVFLLGAGYTLKHDGHVRVDMLYERMGLQRRAWVDLLGTLLFLLPVCFTIIYFSWTYVLNSWADFEGSIEERGLHAVYLLKTCIWLFAGLLILQGIATVIRTTRLLRSPGNRPEVTPELIVGGMLLALMAALLAGFPVAFTLSGVALLAAALGAAVGMFDFSFVAAFPNRIYGIMTNDLLIAVPLFVFMGVMLERSRIAEELLTTMGAVAGRYARRPRNRRDVCRRATGCFDRDCRCDRGHHGTSVAADHAQAGVPTGDSVRLHLRGRYAGTDHSPVNRAHPSG